MAKLAYFCVRLTEYDIKALSEVAAARGSKPRTVAREVLQRYLDRVKLESDSANQKPSAA
jgi:hypothetical protein